jgi:DNA-binding HxlR family transcriptional regulator
MKQGFGQFCPISNACEIFAGRWTPIILRELMAGSHRFNEIHRCIPLISRALLARRLRELEAAGVVTSVKGGKGRAGEYHLTPAGLEFKPAIEALGTWGQRWAVRFQPENLDAGLLMWNVRRRIDREKLPDRRVMVYFRYGGFAPGYRGPREFWLMLERAAVDICLSDPGHDIDLCVEADIGAMARVWLGDMTFAEALAARKVAVRGPRDLAKRFPSWLLLSPFARVPRADGAPRGA